MWNHRSASSSTSRSSDWETPAIAASTPSSPTFCAAAPGPWSSSETTYEPSGRCCARSATIRHSQGAKHDSAPVWQTGPARRTRSRIASPSQSSRISSTARVLPEVAPLCQYSSRERLQNQASPLSRVRRSASSSMYASISTRPEAASCTIAGIRS